MGIVVRLLARTMSEPALCQMATAAQELESFVIRIVVASQPCIDVAADFFTMRFSVVIYMVDGQEKFPRIATTGARSAVVLDNVKTNAHVPGSRICGITSAR
jgi:hypothetical protein